jgi:hypothetical protein
MSKAGRWLVVAGGIVLVGQGLLHWGVETLWAQAKSERATPVFQYVGVEQTIARVDTATGRIEILAKRGEPRASLLTKDSKAWEWMEVPVRPERHSEEGKGEPVGEQPKGSRPALEEPGASDR